jgi:hypothetical protein
MSLRRPRIKSAVNLAALANGRRKEPVQEDVPAAVGKDPTAEPPSIEPATVDTPTNGDNPAAPSGVDGHKVPADVPGVTEHVLSAETAPEDVPGEADHATAPETVPDVPPEAATTPTDPGPASGSDPKPLDSPFSPPPARPAPVGRFKPRFRPNLNENRNRIRRYSGTLMDMVRFPQIC